MAFEDHVRFNVTLDIEPPQDFYRRGFNARATQPIRAAQGQRINGMFTWVEKLKNSDPFLIDEFAAWATRAEARMKERAAVTWTRYTGQAEKGLHVETQITEAGARIIATNLAKETENYVPKRNGGEPYGPYTGREKYYGIFLEVGMGGRFAVIWPTIQEMKGELNDALKHRMDVILRTT